MLTILPILQACKNIKPTHTPAEINRLIMPLCTEYCKQHPDSDQLVLIVQYRGMRPLLYSWSYNFSLVNLHDKVQSALQKAKKGRSEDIIIIEWLTHKGIKIPYYQITA